MNITETINHLEEIKKKFGNLEIVGGYMHDTSGLDDILVIDNDSEEIFPKEVGDKTDIQGVFFT